MTQSQHAASSIENGTPQILPASDVIKYSGIVGITFTSEVEDHGFAQLAGADLCFADVLRHSIREYRERSPAADAVKTDTWVQLYSEVSEGFDATDGPVARGFHGAGDVVTVRATLVVDEDGLFVRIYLGDKEVESPFMFWGDLDVALGVAKETPG